MIVTHPHAPPERAHPTSIRRIPGIEGTRAVAAGAIVLLHVWGYATPGDRVLGDGTAIAVPFEALALGVTLFFALSGFLLYLPFVRAVLEERDLRVASYARNRALRILPAYWVALAASALLLGGVFVRTAGGGPVVGRMTDPGDLLLTAGLVQNLRPATVGTGIGPAWSLAVEVQFYVVLPILATGVAALARGTQRSRRTFALALAPAALLALGLSGKAVAAWVVTSPKGEFGGFDPTWHAVVERSLWAQADLFAFGMALAVVHAYVESGRLRLPRRWRPRCLGMAAVVLLPCVITAHGFEQTYLVQNTGEALALGLVLATVVLPADPPGPRRVLRLLESRFALGMGLSSYSLFLWHEPLIHWLERHDVTRPGWGGLAANIVIVAVFAGAIATLSYRYVELPALRRKRPMIRAERR